VCLTRFANCNGPCSIALRLSSGTEGKPPPGNIPSGGNPGAKQRSTAVNPGGGSEHEAVPGNWLSIRGLGSQGRITATPGKSRYRQPALATGSFRTSFLTMRAPSATRS